MFMSDDLWLITKYAMKEILLANTMWMWQGAIGVSKYYGSNKSFSMIYHIDNKSDTYDELEYLDVFVTSDRNYVATVSSDAHVYW